MKQYIEIVIYGIVFLIIFIYVVNSLIYLGTKSFVYNEVNDVPSATVGIVPGAAVSPDGVLSPVFVDRLDMVISLYVASKVTKILVSGDNSTDDYNEVNPARLYLISNGVLDNDIYLDHAGFDTYSSMYRARDIFQVSSAIVSSQSFHLPRSILIARGLGIDAYGMNADVGHLLFKNTIREILANQKAVFELLFHIKPKFLGDAIPIT